jgi:ABC-type nickel/cobalt efflux system permease component RcnA
MDGSLVSIVAAAMGLGLLHGIEPGHGWPIAASYGLARANRYVAGMTAGIVLGVGHLVSSIAVVIAFFGLKAWFDLGELGWMNVAAGALLVAVGLWELRGALSGGGHGHHHHDHHHHGHGHTHDHGLEEAGADKGLWGLAGAAFALGFAHEEEVQMIGICAGTDLCLSLMLIYALTVIAAITALTLLLIAGFQHFRHRLEHLAPHLPKLSAAILIAMGVGFMAGVI